MAARLIAVQSTLRTSRVARAASWSTASFAILQFVRIVTSIILAHLLAPEMFGVMAIIFVIQGIMTLLSDFGVRLAVVQSKRGDEPTFVNTAWSLEILRGTGTWLVGVIIAIGLHAAGSAGWLGETSVWSSPELPMALAVTIFVAVISGLQSTKLLTAQRNLEGRELAVIELTGQIACSLIMILIANIYATVWALVAGVLASAMLTTAMSHFWLRGSPNRFLLDRQAIVEIFGTGRWILLSSGLYAISNNLDRFVFAAYVTAAQLGLYSIALNLQLLVEAVGNRIFATVALPTLSKTAHDAPAKFRNDLMRLRLPVDIAFLFAAGLLFATGPKIVEIIYDERYLDAGFMVQFLSFSLVFSRYGILNMAYVALGQASFMAMTTGVRVVTSLTLMLPLLHWYGLPGGLLAVAIHGAPSVAYQFWVNSRLGLNDLGHEIRVLAAWPAGYATGLAGIALLRLVGV
ncbi:MAG: oligosaccharide flippase family protein [Hyphomicrobium sp.]